MVEASRSTARPPKDLPNQPLWSPKRNRAVPSISFQRLAWPGDSHEVTWNRPGSLRCARDLSAPEGEPDEHVGLLRHLNEEVRVEVIFELGICIDARLGVPPGHGSRPELV